MVNRIASVLLLSALCLCVAGKGVFGPCPSVSGVDNFDIGSYLGTWYEIVRTTDMPFEEGDCSQAHYSVLPTGRVNVTNSEVRSGVVTYAFGQAYCDNDGSANCHVKFYWLSPYSGYQVLSTDYTQYAVVYSCFSIGVYHWSYGWLLSRTPTIDAEYEDLLQVPDLGPSDFSHTNQGGCPPRNY